MSRARTHATDSISTWLVSQYSVLTTELDVFIDGDICLDLGAWPCDSGFWNKKKKEPNISYREYKVDSNMNCRYAHKISHFANGEGEIHLAKENWNTFAKLAKVIFWPNSYFCEQFFFIH